MSKEVGSGRSLDQLGFRTNGYGRSSERLEASFKLKALLIGL